MHVTIVQLTNKGDTHNLFEADEVFDENQDRFPDGVTQHTGAARKEDIKTVLNYLGPAAKSRTTDGKTWITIDRNKAIDLFVRPFNEFLKKLDALRRNDLRDFATGGHEIECKLQALNEAYHFDGIYVMEEGAYAQPISDWLRYIIRYPDVPTRYCFQATYDGDQ